MSDELRRYDITDHDRAYWLADKIHALGDYAKEAAAVLLSQADRLAAAEARLAEIYNAPEVKVSAHPWAVHKTIGDSVLHSKTPLIVKPKKEVQS